jgi:hypothetical protein
MKLNYLTFVHLFHILFVGSLFLYIGIERTNIPSIMFPFLKYLGLFIILYHSYKTYLNVQGNKSAWINLFHILLIGPLLVIIGSNGVNTSRKYFELLLMAGFAAIGYHGYYLLF